MRRALLSLTASLLASSCAPPNNAKPYPTTEVPDDGGKGTVVATPSEPSKPAGLVRYFDREIDLEPFLVGYPYGRFKPSLRTKSLFYFTLGDAYTLKMLPLA